MTSLSAAAEKCVNQCCMQIFAYLPCHHCWHNLATDGWLLVHTLAFLPQAHIQYATHIHVMLSQVIKILTQIGRNYFLSQSWCCRLSLNIPFFFGTYITFADHLVLSLPVVKLAGILYFPMPLTEAHPCCRLLIGS